jgi:predicted amidohydrolase YtcJ
MKRLINLIWDSELSFKKRSVNPSCLLFILAHGLTIISIFFPIISNASPQKLTLPVAESAYINGIIYTIDPSRTLAQAVAIRDGKFIAVGSNELVKKYISDDTKVTDLNGQMVMPGIHDAHTHLETAGMRFHHECLLPIGAGENSILATLQRCEKKRPGGWITSGTYDPNVFPNREANSAFLSKAFPNTPVYLHDYTIHHALVNDRALELAGIDDSTPDPPGGMIVRNTFTGKATGKLVESAAALVTRVIPAFESAVYRKAILWAASTSNKFGITSVQEASANRRQLEILNDLDSKKEMTVRVSAHLVWQNEKFGDAPVSELRKLIQDRNNYNSEHVDTQFLKIWLDGAPLPPNYTASNLTKSGEIQKDKLLITESELANVIAKHDKQGMVVKMHVAGPGAARTALNALQQARNRNGDSGVLHELSHLGFVHEDDMARMNSLGAIAEMSPAVWHIKAPGYEILQTGFKFNTLQKHNVITVVGSDWILPPTPNLFPALEGMLDRGEESIELAVALEAMTINGARVTGQDHLIGSIEAGKLATFIVLDRNLFEVPISEVGETTVLKTIFEGKVVFQTH